MHGCHAAACRRLTAWCGYAFAGTASASASTCASASSTSSAASGALCTTCDLSGCACTQDAGRLLGAARAAARRAPPRSARHSLRLAVDHFLFSCFLYPTGAFFGRSRRALAGCAHVGFSRFSPFGASKREKFSGLAGAHGHSSRELAL